MNRVLTRYSADELWRAALHLCLYGSSVSPRGRVTYERRGVHLCLTADSGVVESRARRLNYSFMVAEWLWMLFGHRDVASIVRYNSQIAQFSDDGDTFFGAYGPSLAAQLPQVIALLRRDPDTRQAVISTWRPKALVTRTKDVPCTLTWQFFIRDGALELHVSMRSNDAWLGLPYDLFNFTQTQRLVAATLGVDVGPYYHNVGSLHLYEEHVARAKQVLLTCLSEDTATGSTEPLPPLPAVTWPPPPAMDDILCALPYVAQTSSESVELYITDRTDPGPWLAYATLLLSKFKQHRQVIANLLPSHARLCHVPEATA